MHPRGYFMKLKISFALVLTSFLVHLYLMNSHYEFRYGFDAKKSLCSISETLNCEAVSISPYSQLAGLPMATWGFAFHLSFLFLFGLLITQPNRRGSVLRFIKFFALLSLLASVVMGAISITMMSTYCLFCILLYILSIANFLVLTLIKDVSFFPSSEDLKALLKKGEQGLLYILVAILSVPLVTVLAHDVSTRDLKKKSAHLISDVLREWESAIPQEFGDPLFKIGKENAEFTIVEFADFQCIHCKNASHSLHSFIASRKNSQLQFFTFPLDGSCNPAIESTRSGKSCILSKAVYCAQKQEKGFHAYQWIFDRFGTDENSNFEKMSSDLNLNYGNLNACVQSEEAHQVITEQAKAGKQAGVDGTPAVFVNGKKLSAGHLITVLEALYKRLHP
jgi:uncharacterized membrane protein